MPTLQDAKEITETIVKSNQPLAVIVFGSVARNGTGNDVDLCIVFEDKDVSIKLINQSVNKNIKHFYKRFAIDPFVVLQPVLQKYFRNGSPFLRLIQREGRVLYMRDSIKQWLHHCNEDLESAKYLLLGKFYRGACYHSEQAVEKSLKALLIKKGWELEKIHNIERLKEIVADYGIVMEVDDDDIVFIDSIYRGRYPGEEGLLPLGEPNEGDAERAVSIANDVVKEVLKYI